MLEFVIDQMTYNKTLQPHLQTYIECLLRVLLHLHCIGCLKDIGLPSQSVAVILGVHEDQLGVGCPHKGSRHATTRASKS